MLDRLRQWQRQRILRKAGVGGAEWAGVLAALPATRGLSPAQCARLRELTVLFLHGRQVVTVGDLQLDRGMRLRLGALACLPILELDLSWYSACSTLVLYPGDFMARHRYRDDAGLEHQDSRPLSGEAWSRGPVVLSWSDVEQSGQLDGFNVVIHEFAHKLDMLNGEANGYPPLHRGMAVDAWTAAFSQAYDHFSALVDAGDPGWVLDAYAAENPAEFFAVTSEVFFERPHGLRGHYPAVYEQLAAFYRQSPAERLDPWAEQENRLIF